MGHVIFGDVQGHLVEVQSLSVGSSHERGEMDEDGTFLGFMGDSTAMLSDNLGDMIPLLS
jgi:hypothetical protein